LQFCKLYTVIEKSSQEKKEEQTVLCNVTFSSKMSFSDRSPIFSFCVEVFKKFRHSFASVFMRFKSASKYLAIFLSDVIFRFGSFRPRSKVTKALRKIILGLYLKTGFRTFSETKTPARFAGVEVIPRLKAASSSMPCKATLR